MAFFGGLWLGLSACATGTQSPLTGPPGPASPASAASPASTTSPVSPALPPGEHLAYSGPLDPAHISVVIRSRPSSLEVDGVLREWGSLAPTGDAATEINPQDARSRVALSISSAGVLLAADLAGVAKNGVWLGLGSEVPALAPVGELYTRSGAPLEFDCAYEQLPGPEGSFDRGKKLSAAASRECEALKTKYAAVVQAHGKTFEQLLRIDSNGVALRAPDGKFVPITAREITVTPQQEGMHVEALLPLDVLPRLVESPLTSLRVAAEPLDPGSAPRITGAWSAVSLPTPQSFEPLGSLRDNAYAAITPMKLPSGYRIPRTAFPTGMSYHPTDPTHIRTMRHIDWGPTELVARDETLYRKQATLGDVEVGLVSAYGESLAILKKGKLVHFLPLFGDVPVEYAQPTRIRGMVERGGELHIIFFRPDHLTQQYGRSSPEWVVLAVRPDGTIRSPIGGPSETTGSNILPADFTMPMYPYESADFASRDLDSFGIKGIGRIDDPKGNSKEVAFEIAWKWDPEKLAYTQTYRETKPPKKK